MKRAAGARVALDRDAPTHHLDERRGDREAESSASKPPRRRPVSLTERFEDRVLFVCGDPDPRVGHGKVEHRAAVVPDVLTNRDHHMAALRELDGVADQIRDDLLHPHRIADDAGRHVGRDITQQLQALLVRAHGQWLQRIADGVGERKGYHFDLESARFDLREVEDIVENRQQRLGRRFDGVEAVGLIRRELGVECQRRHPDNAIHRRANLVAHVRQELALRPGGVLRGFLGLRQFLLRHRPFGAVADDRREPDGPAFGVAIERHRLLVPCEVGAEQQLPRAAEEPAEGVVDVAVVAGAVDDGARVFDLIEDRIEADRAERQPGRHLLVESDFARQRRDSPSVRRPAGGQREFDEQLVTVPVQGGDAL